jgi:hypothetical protein
MSLSRLAVAGRVDARRSQKCQNMMRLTRTVERARAGRRPGGDTSYGDSLRALRVLIEIEESKPGTVARTRRRSFKFRVSSRVRVARMERLSGGEAGTY